MTYYLRVEAVNLRHFVFDTEDLSTIRGGSLLMLDSPQMLIDSKKFPIRSVITQGASAAIFEVECDDADKLRSDVESWFNEHPSLKHATFVVDIVQAQPGNFVQCRETLITRNRWRQMRSPSLPFPPRAGASAPCPIDKVRPADAPSGAPRFSSSVLVRHEYGRTEKQNFYLRCSPPRLPAFTNTLEEIARCERLGNLNNKMAVIHLDGNGFGQLQNDQCTTAALQFQWDQNLRNHRTALLRSLLDATVGANRWTYRNNGESKHRLETLLWGGDEIIWVVPAWAGWETLELFYKESSTWTFGRQPLTHCAGMVFCHHKAPIHSITRLACALTEEAKTRARAAPAGSTLERNLFAYQVLESFDSVGVNFEGFRCSRVPPGAANGRGCLSVPGEQMEQIRHAIVALRRAFPKRKLHAIVQDLLGGQRNRARDSMSKVKGELDGASQVSLAALENSLGGDEAALVHLLELWDYVVDPNEVERICS